MWGNIALKGAWGNIGGKGNGFDCGTFFFSDDVAMATMATRRGNEGIIVLRNRKRGLPVKGGQLPQHDHVQHWCYFFNRVYSIPEAYS